MWAFCQHTQRRFECTHGGALKISHTHTTHVPHVKHVTHTTHTTHFTHTTMSPHSRISPPAIKHVRPQLSPSIITLGTQTTKIGHASYLIIPTPMSLTQARACYTLNTHNTTQHNTHTQHTHPYANTHTHTQHEHKHRDKTLSHTHTLLSKPGQH